MLHVEAGTFTIGATHARDRSPFAEPAHPVTLSSDYCIDRTEVTTRAFAECTAAACNVPEVDNTTAENCLRSSTHPRHPRNCVTWFEAKAYCEWRGGRLPTEAEWEHAARGPEGRRFPWGNERLEVRNLARDQTVRIPEPVGTFAQGRTPTGLEDMVGNVAEWTLDWWKLYEPAAVVDPRGPDQGEHRIHRGGAFDGLPEDLTATARPGSAPDVRLNYVGFRCVRTPT